jgi:hypothetical protein
MLHAVPKDLLHRVPFWLEGQKPGDPIDVMPDVSIEHI